MRTTKVKPYTRRGSSKSAEQELRYYEKTGKRSLFTGKTKSAKLAREITITSPSAFHESIKKVHKGNYGVHEYRALLLAQNRAKALLHRKHLSEHERKELHAIVKMHIPKPLK